MAESLSDARARAILKLQHHRDSRDPNSFEHKAADHAIDLVLNERRPEGPFLAHNALRDARKILARQRRRHVARYPDGEEQLVTISATDADTPSASLGRSPADLAEWREAYERVREAAAKQDPRAAICLDDWRDGFSDKQTALKLGISRSYVHVMRNTARHCGSDFMREAA
jgi:hypothetical protein